MEHNFNYLFFELTRLIHRHSLKMSKNTPISLHELWILLLLKERDMLSIRQIQKELQLAHNTVSELVQRLEKMKLVEKTTDQKDRRVRRIHITPLGNKLAEQQERRILELGNKIFGSIPDNQQNLVIEAFQILLRVLQNEMG